MVFLARHFEVLACDCSVEERAERLVTRCPPGHWAFKQNVADAFEVLRDVCGGTVSSGVYQRLLDLLAAGVPPIAGARLLGFLRLTKAQEVPFETFKDAVTALCVVREVVWGPVGDQLSALDADARRQVVAQFLGRGLGVKVPAWEEDQVPLASATGRRLASAGAGAAGPEPGAGADAPVRAGFGLFGPLGQFGDPAAADWGATEMVSGIMDAVLQRHPAPL